MPFAADDFIEICLDMIEQTVDLLPKIGFGHRYGMVPLQLLTLK
jgi:hypothetical protein